MTSSDRRLAAALSRRAVLKAGAAGAALVAAPTVLRAQAPAVKLGIIQPVTGALAEAGDLGRLGAELAIADINAAGGLKALGGAKIEMVFADNRSNPEAAAQEVERLQGEKVAAIVGGFGSGLCMTATQAAARYDLPYLVDVGVADAITKRGLKNTFRMAPSFSMATEVALKNLVTLNDAAGKPVKTVVIVHEDGLFGSGLAKLLGSELPKLGFEVLETISHPTPARDMSNIALRIRSLKPDLVIPSNYYGEFVLLARTMQQQRIRPKAIYAIFGGGASSLRFVKEFPQAADGVIDCNHWHDPKNPKSADIRARTEAAGKSYVYNVPLNYSAVMLMAEAIEVAGGVASDKLIAALSSRDFGSGVMPYGRSKFVEGQNVSALPLNTQIQDNDVKVIYPDAFAQVKPVFPLKA
ncbi:ABC transporter substrate-binding protein [Rhodoplanes elegans]|uniref:ABC transporter substrate-binding protein n=1 Tax=Rhodoplanes elegans TaxID=29408 RepID=A0A327KY70_9BRAD|nr:ABC transporter substrate-binding protein [Rhodoplanes elegans]MBK5960437.1 ABC transporter substrate-binding protein [Rhodoplanes elegans]RAI42112.1 ABC transporter substrate-binding protein [Rhodoplanes elegans]